MESAEANFAKTEAEARKFIPDYDESGIPVAICKEGMGNWALEVEEYHGRNPLQGFPSAIPVPRTAGGA